MKDYKGLSFNGCSFVKELTPAVSSSGNKRRVAVWKCGCGNRFIAAMSNVSSGQVRSCGCLKRLAVIKRCLKHGHSPFSGATKLYRFWQSMKDRCTNANNRSYKYYGGRGINMEKSWVNSFEKFRKWFNSHFGIDYIPNGVSIDRKNNNGDYAPGNLRFATLEIQANNKRNNKIVIYRGRKFTVAQLSKKTGIKPGTLWARLFKQRKTVKQSIL